MFVRVTIEFYVLPPETTERATKPPVQPASPSRSDNLKAAFNAELEKVGGFRNWHESIIAEQMLDDPDSVFESLDEEHRYLLEGYYDDDFLHIFINWEYGKQPYVLKTERERLYRRVK